MQTLYYLPLGTDSRPAIIDRCTAVLDSGRKVIYLAPSREVIFAVRAQLTEATGGILHAFVGGFDDLEAALTVDAMAGRQLLDETASRVLLGRLSRDLAPTLTYFGRAAGQTGFIAAAYRVIKHLKRGDLTPEDFAARLPAPGEPGGETLGGKCADILALYRAYEAAKQAGGLLDIDDISRLAVDRVGDNPALADTGLVVVDGFINIDPINRRLLQTMVAAYPAVEFIGYLPFQTAAAQAFLEREILGDLRGMGFTEGALEGPPPAHPELAALARSLSTPAAAPLDAVPGLRILDAPNIEDEVRQTFHRIKSLLSENGEEPADIAIIPGSFTDYQAAILSVGAEMGIPLNLGWQEPLVHNPLYLDILNLLRLKAQPTAREHLTGALLSRYLVPDPAALTPAADTMEKLLSGGPSPDLADLASRLAQPAPELGLTSEQSAGLSAQVRLVNRLLDRLSDRASLPVYCRAVGEMLAAAGIKSRLLALFHRGRLAADLLFRDLKALDALHRVLSSLERAYSLTGAGSEVSLDEFLAAFRAAGSEATITLRRPDAAGVKVISPDLPRGTSYNHVFFLGLNEGVFPHPPVRSGIFTVGEGETLFGLGINIYPYSWEYRREQLRFSFVLAAARATLTLSWRTAGEDGAYLIKSPALEEVLGRLTPAARAVVTGSARRSLRQRFACDPAELWSGREAREKLTTALWQGTGEELTGLAPLVTGLPPGPDPDFVRRAGLMELSRSLAPELDAYDGRIPGRQLPQQGLDYGFSASQLNGYLSCPFRYYLERVLGLGTYEEETELTARSEGTMYHAVLRQYYADTDDYYQLDGELLGRCLSTVFGATAGTGLDRLLLAAKEGEMYRVLAAFLGKDIANRATFRQVTGHDLLPAYLEQWAAERQPFRGRLFRVCLDRVDLEYRGDTPTGRFVIYDYKLGSTPNFRSCLRGEDYQLLIYYYCLVSILRREKGIADPECIALYFSSIRQGKRDGLVRSDYKKALGEPRRQNVVAPAVFATLLAVFNERALALVDRICAGEFALTGRCGGGYFGCDYEALCRHDPYRLAGKKGVAQ